MVPLQEGSLLCPLLENTAKEGVICHLHQKQVLAYVAVVHKLKVMPNQFSKILVALPLTDFLSYSGFLNEASLILKLKPHAVFPLGTSSFCLWFDGLHP